VSIYSSSKTLLLFVGHASSFFVTFLLAFSLNRIFCFFQEFLLSQLDLTALNPIPFSLRCAESLQHG